MASKTVSQLKIKLGLENSQVFDKLRGSFRQLEKTVGVTDQGIEELRQGTIKYAEAGAKSIQVIKGQLDAFRGLRDQATVGSRAYIRLTSDISRLTTELKKLDASLKDTERQATRTFGQVLGGIPSRAPSKFARDIGTLNNELNKYSVTSKRYGDILTEITQRTQAFTTAQARQAVIAAARPLQTQAVGAIRLDEKLPNTTAALRLQIAELTQQLDNADRKSTDYYIIQNRLNVLQKELTGNVEQQAAAYDRLAAAQDASIRRAKKLADIQEYYRTQGPLAPGAGGYRDPVTGAMIARGTRAGIVPIGGGGSGAGNLFPSLSVSEMMALQGRGGRARPRMGAGGYAQVAGAALSGGIFGGPEGAGGALLGGAIGGVPGAFAGAAAGAQVSMIREALSSTADYAAQLEKMRIALRGVAGGQAEYERGLSVAATVTQQFNVPQQTAIEGMTRLTAAVKGANGNVGDAALVFRNVTAAIKATGGGAQDVQSAITAMVQVFSKGKVSAEELSGQLGERLPGAVTMFAEANKMTLPELQKNLRDGTVGLDELMKFIVKLGDTYQGTAREISDSNAEAGARLTITINALREKVGQALGPVGAAFQNAFNEFIKDIAPQVVVLAQRVAKGLKLLLDNTDKIAGIAKFAAAFAGVNLVLRAFTAMQGPISATFTLLQGALGKTTQESIVAQQKLGGVLSTLRRLAAIGVITVGVNYVINRIEKARSIAALRARLEAGGTGATLAGQSRETVEAEQKAALKRKLEIEQEFAAFTADQKSKFLAYQVPVLNTVLAQQATEFSEKLGLEYRDLQTVLKLDPSKFKSAFDEITPSDFADPTGGDGDSGGKGKRKMLQAELGLRDRVRLAIFKNNELEKLGAEFALDRYMAALETEDPLKRENDLREALSKFEQGLLKYREDQNKEAERQNKLAEEAAKKERAFNTELADRKYKLGLINEEEYNRLLIERERARLKDAYPDLDPAQREEMVALKQQEIDPTPFQEMKQNIAQLKQELTDLLNPVNQITGAANAIGTAFSTSFTNVINGSQTAQQALAGFFQNIANYFLDMASQIIAKMITMAILNTIVGLLPGGGGGGAAPSTKTNSIQSGSDFGLKGNIISMGGPDFAAKGAYFAGGVAKFAMGGIVDKPTMFAYANGGTGRFGLMGEAGPEAIMPLKRGPDGKLGVQASGSIGNIIVNVDATGTDSKAEDTDAKQLGQAIGIAVQQELIKQKRPGGLLA